MSHRGAGHNGPVTKSQPGVRPSRTFEPMPLPLPWWERIPMATLTLALLLAVLLTIALVIPVPYAVRMPGPTVDTLGEADDTELITIDDAESYPSDGELRLTTVSASGGPGYPVGIIQALRGFLDPKTSVLPREAVFPSSQTQEEAKEQGQAQMTSSQESATAAALAALGYQVPATVEVAAVGEDGPSAGVVEVGDIVRAIEVEGERTEVTTFTDLLDVLAATPPGTTVTLEVDRDGVATSLAVTTAENDAGGSVLGVLIDPEFDFPVEVTIQIHDIGGPSAGLMFALGIMELLTPGDATGGDIIAGTGTIDLEGNVGTIGGIVQKMNGAVRDGAEYFLAPSGNCGEVVGNVPDGLQAVAVTTLEDAWSAVEAIGRGESTDLPTCN